MNVDIFTIMVSQKSRAFGTTIEVEALVKNLVNKNKGFMTWASEAEEATKKVLAEVKALKKGQDEEFVKFAFALAEIESLKEEVHLSQSEVTSLTKRVEIFDAYQKLAVEALETANKEDVALKEQVEKLNSRTFVLVEEVEISMREAESARNEAEKRYMANFCLMEAYQSFGAYRRMYAYTKVVEWIKANLQAVNILEVRKAK